MTAFVEHFVKVDSSWQSKLPKGTPNDAPLGDDCVFIICVHSTAIAQSQESTISDIQITECYFAIAKCYLPIGKCYFAIAKLRSSFSESCVCKPYTATHCPNSLVIGAKLKNI